MKFLWLESIILWVYVIVFLLGFLQWLRVLNRRRVRQFNGVIFSIVLWAGGAPVFHSPSWTVIAIRPRRGFGGFSGSVFDAGSSRVWAIRVVELLYEEESLALV